MGNKIIDGIPARGGSEGVPRKKSSIDWSQFNRKKTRNDLMDCDKTI